MAEHSWPVPERRNGDQRVSKLSADVIFLREEVGHLKDRVVKLEDGLVENTELTRQVADDTGVLREILVEAKGAIKFLCRMAQAWRFLLRYILLPAIGLVLLAYYFTHGYQFPEWFKGLAEWLK